MVCIECTLSTVFLSLYKKAICFIFINIGITKVLRSRIMDYRKIESFQPSESYIRNEEKVYYGTSQPSEDCTKIQMLNSKCGNSPIEMDSDKGTCREIDQPSGSSTERQMPDGSKLPIEADKNLEKNREMREETDKAEVVLNICPGRSDFSIKVNGTSLTTSSTSLNATIGNFSLSVNFLDYPCNRPLPFTVAVASVSLGKPLFVVLGSYPYVTAAVSLSKDIIAMIHVVIIHLHFAAKGISNPNSYELVSIQSNGQGMYYMSANKNAYYVAIISGNKVRVLSESEIANVSL